MKNATARKQKWLRIYSRMLDAYTPEKCSRCRKPGFGWKHRGGDFEPHHIAGREGWRQTLFVAVCPQCHNWIHNKQRHAINQHWKIDPKHETE